MVKIVCKKGDNIYTLSVSTEMIEDFGVVEVYGIRIMGECCKAEIKDISEDYYYVKHLFDLIVEEELYPEHFPKSYRLDWQWSSRVLHSIA